MEIIRSGIPPRGGRRSEATTEGGRQLYPFDRGAAKRSNQKDEFIRERGFYRLGNQ